MDIRNIDNWKNKMIQIAEFNFAKDGNLTPIFLILAENNQHIIIPNFKDQQSKEISLNTVKNFCKSKKVDAIITISECWAKKIKKGDDIPNCRVSEMPARQEVVQIIFESRLYREFTVYDIDRNEEKPKLTNKNQVKHIGDALKGLFTDFINNQVNLS